MRNLPTDTSELLLQHADFMRRLAGSLARDSERAEDLVQETWLAALRRPPLAIGRSRAWLALVMRRLAGRSVREDARRITREEAAARNESQASDVEPIEREEMLLSVLDAVLALDEPYRSTILARFYEGQKPQRIAQQQGVPLSTVNSRLQRAQAELRQSLDRRFGEGTRLQAGLLALSFGNGSGKFGPSTTGGLGTTSGVLIMGMKGKLAACGLAFGMGTLFFVNRAPWSGPPSRPAIVAAQPEAELLVPTVEPNSEDAIEAVAIENNPEREVLASTPSAPPATKGNLSLRIVRERSGEPAVGRRVNLFPFDGPEPFRMQREATTDVQGEASFEGLTPGTWFAYIDMGGGGRSTIVAGETTQSEFTLPAGFHVEGQVEDSGGNPIVGATILLSDYGANVNAHPVATTDASGEFWIEDVGSGGAISAFADGYGPTGLKSIGGSLDEIVEVKLTLGRKFAQVDLTVLDEMGFGISGISVQTNRPIGHTRSYSAGLAPRAHR